MLEKDHLGKHLLPGTFITTTLTNKNNSHAITLFLLIACMANMNIKTS